MNIILIFLSCSFTTLYNHQSLLKFIDKFSVEEVDNHSKKIILLCNFYNEEYFRRYNSFLEGQLIKENKIVRVWKYFSNDAYMDQLFYFPIKENLFELIVSPSEYSKQLMSLIFEFKSKMKKSHNDVLIVISKDYPKYTNLSIKFYDIQIHLNVILIEVFHLLPMICFYLEGITENVSHTNYENVRKTVVNYNYKLLKEEIDSFYESLNSFINECEFSEINNLFLQLHLHTKLLIDDIIKLSNTS